MKLAGTFFLTTLFIFINLYARCQDTALQGLLSQPNDTGKIQRLADYARDIINEKPEQIPALANTILSLSRQLHYNEGIATAFSFLGYREKTEGRALSSIGYYNQALIYYKKCNDQIGIAKIYGNLANVYDALGKIDSAITYRIAAIGTLEKQPPVPALRQQHQVQLSTQYFNLAIDYDNNLRQADKALYYYKKSEAMAREVKDTGMIIAAMSQIIVKSLEKGQINEVTVAAEEMLSLSKAFNDYINLSKAYWSYSEVLSAKNQLKEAAQASQQAIKYATLAENVELFMIASSTLAAILEKNKNYDAQIKVLEKALKQAKEAGYKDYADEMYVALAEANYKLGNYKIAFDYLKNETLLKEADLKEKNNRILAEAEYKYQTEKKEKLLSQQQLQLAQNKVRLQKSKEVNIYSIGAAIIGLLATCLIWVHYKNKRRLHQKQLQAVHQEKEIQLLQALMQGEEKERSRIAKDLHDGVAGMLAAVKMHFSSLPEADNLLLTEGYRQGMKLLNEATQEIRKTSHNLMPEVLLQHGLDEALRRYCHNVNNSKTLQIQYDSWGEIDRFVDSFELSVYRIVQELLNNIIKHSKATQAMVQVTQQEEVLSISIEDNGVGFSKPNDAEGMGLRSLQSRIRAMNGKMEMQASEQSGVSAYLEFEIAELKKEIALQYA